MEAKRAIQEISESLQDFHDHKLPYDCISPRNVVIGEGGKCQLSVVGLLLGVDKDSPEYSVQEIQDPEHRITFSLGCLLFKLAFGFSPVVTRSGKLDSFSFSIYLKVLHEETSQRLLKVYHFV
jgi:hypothetical protein